MLESHTIAQSVTLEELKNQSMQFLGIASEVSKIIVGQQEIIDFILIAILCNGHILLEGVPGVAKTTMIKAMTRALGLTFNRIQFTPDLLPSDLLGTLMYNQKNHEFETKKGPIFAHLILADEINRAPAKVQSALLESMQEQQVTLGSTTFALPQPFLVFATQNPIEQEGTYQLPEAQVDRFMFKLHVGYPTRDQEQELLSRNLDTALIRACTSIEQIRSAQALAQSVYVDKRVRDYIVDIIRATREPHAYPQLADIAPYIACGSSPRGSLALKHASMAHAFLKQRNFVTPDDVKKVAPKVLHRIALSYEAEADLVNKEQIVHRILGAITCP